MAQNKQYDLFEEGLKEKEQDVPVFYNTIHVEGEEKKEIEEKFSQQEERILKIFQDKATQMTPFDVEALYSVAYAAVPITSIRRAITNLTTKKKLVKCPKEEGMKEGNYGKLNHYWKLS